MARSKNNPGRTVAFCGLMSALAVVIMFVFSLIGVGTFAGPYAASIVFIAIQDEFGDRAAVMTYIATSIVSFLIMPDRELAVFFACFAWYAIAFKYVNRIPGRPVRIAVKLGIYLGIIAVMYGVLSRVLGFAEAVEEELVYFYGGVALLGLAPFLMFDKVYESMLLAWRKKWRARLLR